MAAGVEPSFEDGVTTLLDDFITVAILLSRIGMLVKELCKHLAEQGVRNHAARVGNQGLRTLGER
jgi:hypothetical protein